MISLLIAFNLGVATAPANSGAAHQPAFAQRGGLTLAAPESITVRNANESSSTTSKVPNSTALR